MTAGPRPTTRCIIYTRKSSEEGLEQSFNSLDAQREACQAFIASQRQEGWRLLPARYDDGGYSGGSMDRPALRRLLQDVQNAKLDTIVVYKVDRLTRSLADFAKIIEILDAHRVAFMSVTQQFNTTTSMGRLTLNVLLSFAQFEREVTGERIRDKIAASKRKGMWMGGHVPLGYDLKQRKLLPNPEEAKLVCDIYRRYLQLGCVSKLKAYLDQQGNKSKLRISGTGRRWGGAFYSRGALYQILHNRIYLGEIPHRDQSYPGEHQAIIPEELWEQVQSKLKSDNQGRRNGLKMNCPSLLVGLLQDAQGNRFAPSHTVKNGKRYRYYFCPAADGNSGGIRGGTTRLPAHDVEQQVWLRLVSFLKSPKEVMDQLGTADDRPPITRLLLTACRKLAHGWSARPPAENSDFLRKVVRRVLVHPDKLEVLVSKTELRAALSKDGQTKILSAEFNHVEDDVMRLEMPSTLKRCGSEVRLVVPPASGGEMAARLSPSLLKALARAHDWYERVLAGKAHDITSLSRLVGLSERYVSRVSQCAFLAPDIVESILEGHQPPDLTFAKLCEELPLDWAEQRKKLGFPAAAGS